MLTNDCPDCNGIGGRYFCVCGNELSDKVFPGDEFTFCPECKEMVVPEYVECDLCEGTGDVIPGQVKRYRKENAY
jgi:RecJ-like exonuclease